MDPPSLVVLAASCIPINSVTHIQLEKIKPLKKIVSCIKACCYTTNKQAVDHAIKHKHVGCLARLYAFKKYWSFNTTSLAALHGSLECLIFLRTNGCSWDERTCISAATNGHLDCLRYAHTNGCPWDERVCRYSFINGHFKCLDYVCTRGWYLKNGWWYYLFDY